jgi:uncharacterized membrane protein
MPIKTLAIIFFLFIIVSLGIALFHLVKGKDAEQSQKTVKALTYRIGLSVLLFILLFIAFATGLFQPHGIGARIQHVNVEKPVESKP